MCSEMIAYLLSAVLSRFHHSVLMVFLPVFKKEVMGNQAFFPSWWYFRRIIDLFLFMPH